MGPSNHHIRSIVNEIDPDSWMEVHRMRREKQELLDLIEELVKAHEALNKNQPEPAVVTKAREILTEEILKKLEG